MNARNQLIPYKPRIFRQSLLLVLLPFIVSTTLLLLLHQLSAKEEKALAEEIRQTQLVRTLNYLGADEAGYVAKPVAHNAKNYQQLSPFKQKLLDMENWLARLEVLSEGHAKSLSLIKSLQALSHEAAAENIGEDFFSKEAQSGLSLTRIQQLPHVFLQVFRQQSKLKELVDQEWLELDTVRKQHDAALMTELNFVYCCCLGNALMAGVLVFLFASAITSRLRILTINAACIPKLTRFPRQVEGIDELAYLDKVLLQTSKTLEENAEHRKTVIGMVAHDMRSPLMSAQASLQMIEELGVELSNAGFACLDSAYKKLTGIIQYVNALLLVQKCDNDSSAVEDVPTENDIAEPTQIQATVHKTPAVRKINGRANLLSSPKIFHKGLLIVALPLLCQIGLFFFVSQQILSSQSVATKSRRLSDMTLYAVSIYIDYMKGAIGRSIYVFTGKPSFRDISVKVFKYINDDFSKMENTAGNDPDWLDYIKVARHVKMQQRDQILGMQPDTPPDQIMSCLQTVLEIRHSYPEAGTVRGKHNLLQSRESAILDNLELQQTKSSHDLSVILAWSVAANFVLAMALLFAFSTDIDKRLKILIDNAGRLSTRDSLTQMVTGSDELSYLDLILHKAKLQIDHASDQRALMMQSLAQKMSTPLQEAQVMLRDFARLEETLLPKQSNDLLLRAQNNIAVVINLIADLLSLESLNKGQVDLEKSACEAASLCDDAIALVFTLAQKKQINILNRCDSTTMIADKQRVVQVLVNFLANAIKFSNKGTTITVHSQSKQGTLRISVSDQGPGMDESTRNNVFEKFFQASTEEKKQGFGLGLAICKLIIESHGGTLGVESKLGEGSTFWFELPQDETNDGRKHR